MAPAFGDSPRKQLVRSSWNTPLLDRLHVDRGVDFFYWGLPGPEIIDIKLWRPMIQRVVAFEREDSSSRKPRSRIVELEQNLGQLRIPFTVYAGDMEDVVLTIPRPVSLDTNLG